MKKALKILLSITIFFAICVFVFFIWAFASTFNAKLSEDKLISNNKKIVFLDCSNNELISEVKGISFYDINNIPKHVQNAFIAIEDKRFYKHKGIDIKGLYRAFFHNIKNLSFKEGGSTISQQLIKNTHLSNEKTIKRKLIEFKLARKLEKEYSKKQILEMYLNSIYFGEGYYGINEASLGYFNKKPNELTISEGAMLASVIKAPSFYSPKKNYSVCLSRRNVILKKMLEQKMLTTEEYNASITEKIELSKQKNGTKNNFINTPYYKYALKEIDKKPYSFNEYFVKTNLNNEIQDSISIDDSFENYNYSIAILNKNCELVAYNSNCEEQFRQPGSTIKPISVYAPAIEENIVDSCSIVLDEKTTFNGYSPSNYNNKYYGKVSVKESLAKSLNVCACKILNYLGVEKAIKYSNKMGMDFSDDDKNLALALGCCYKGVKLADLLSAYSVFINNGVFTTMSSIKSIYGNKNYIIYTNQQKKEKVFSIDTIEIMRDMLKNNIQNGTAKKLSLTNLSLYAKTGTVGDKKGNTDVYTISFNNEYIMGVWLGAKKELISNDITGGNLPCSLSLNIWENIYKNKKEPKDFEQKYAKSIDLDYISYSEENKIEIADKNSPKRYKTNWLFKQNHLPEKQSNRFTLTKAIMPKTTISSNGILIGLCHTNNINYIIYKYIDNKKIKLLDTKDTSNKEYLDKDISENTTYKYSAVPYRKYDNVIVYGNEQEICKIKTPIYSIDDNWWIND